MSNSGRQDSHTEGRNPRNERSVGKGRRRRAAAEQRRMEQQRWGRYISEEEKEEEDIYAQPPPRPANDRRRARRAARLAARADSPFYPYTEDLSLDMALAISLSLSETNDSGHRQGSSADADDLDLSYENLVSLENVKCVASVSVVESFCCFPFEGNGGKNVPLEMAELCAICQIEYSEGEEVMQLPCSHNFHEGCASEWLSNHSKLCPICKHDVTQ